MKIIVAGASHGVPEYDRACTSIFLVSGGNTYIFDAGADISYLLSHYNLPHKSLKAVFISHGHTDHVDGLVPLCDQLMWFHGFDECVPQIFLPEKKCIIAINTWIALMMPNGPYRRDSVDLGLYEAGTIYDDGVIKVVARQTKHTSRSYSFYVECEGKKLFFTGDLGYGFAEYPSLLGNTEYDIVFCEGAHHDPGTVNEMLKQTPTKQLVIHHLNPEREVELKKLPGTTPFKCEIAYDGYTVEI